jgi:hypothetical protein
MGSITLFADGATLPAGEDALTFYSPNGEFIRNPTEKLLRLLIFRKGHRYYGGGWGGACLQIMRALKGGGITIVRDEPGLEFFFVKPHGFFFRYWSKSGPTLVPHDASARKRLVKHYYGGDPMWVPIACFVSRQVAWETVQEYCRSRLPCTTIKWVPANSLNFGTGLA